MSSHLYLFFTSTGAASGCFPADWVQGLKIPGYSFSDAPPMGNIEAPDEPRLPVRCLLYSGNYFRIYVADRAVLFRSEAPLPSDLAMGEREFQAAILAVPEVRLRRWLATDDDWDDDEKKIVRILGEGKNQETLKTYQALCADA